MNGGRVGEWCRRLTWVAALSSTLVVRAALADRPQPVMPVGPGAPAGGNAQPAPPTEAPPPAPGESTAALSPAAPPSATPSPPAAPGAPTSAPGTNASATPPASAPGTNASATPPAAAPAGEDTGDSADVAELNMKIYADTSFIARTHAGPPFNSTSNWNTFQFPEIELFPTATYDRFSFLAEIMFEADDNEFSIDVERMQLAYSFADWLRVKAGRFHTALGYYNDAYHHAKLFELTTGRPYLVNFEDSYGLLPAHSVGVSGDGTLSLGSAGQFRYDLDIGNGRALDPTAVAVNDAEKNMKLFNLRLRYLPSFLEGAIIGVNAETDEIPGQDTVGPVGAQSAYPLAPPHSLREYVTGAHVVYMENDWHILAEAALIDHIEETSHSTFLTKAGFIELGYSIGAVTPYARWEQIRFGMSALGELDPLYRISIFAGVRNASDARIGFNWLVNEHVAVKLEGRAFLLDSLHQEMATVQVALGF
jgi:hypothetical protein